MDYWLIGELAFTGALVGLMYALVALGIVLVYKTSGVANFAQGAIAMTGGYATWAISAGLGLPMVHGLMAQSGGTMQLESRLGKGTTARC